MPMNPLDWLLAALLAYSVLRAVLRGLVREAFALAGLIAGLLLACWNFQRLALRLRGIVSQPHLAELLSFALIFVAVMVLAALLGKLLSRGASAVGLGLFDRLGGAAFGLVRGTLQGLVLLLALTAFLPAAPWLNAWLKTSSLAPYFLHAEDAVSFVMPRDLRQRLANGFGHALRPQPF